jgi:hypothetical protein
VNQGPRRDCSMKNTEDRKSHDTVPFKSNSSIRKIEYESDILARFESLEPYYRRRNILTQTGYLQDH